MFFECVQFSQVAALHGQRHLFSRVISAKYATLLCVLDRTSRTLGTTNRVATTPLPFVSLNSSHDSKVDTDLQWVTAL